ncbi:MAG: EutP/PduV family microcompartment system protein [Lachnospiraceae bacterium]|nr:EutP/PduV family microcompartment system protein [Lachnospiraceae bacterium]
MKKIILIGTVSCGKTTLCQRLNGLKQIYKKTQALEVVNHTVDTPGEYLEHRSFLRSLMVTATGTELVLFLIDPLLERFMYSPGQASSFMLPVAGVVTKADLATEKQIRQAKELLELAGAHPIFVIDSISGTGMEPLIEFLSETE